MNMSSGRPAARMATAIAIVATLAATDLGWGRGVPVKKAPVVVLGASGKSSCGSAGNTCGSGSSWCSNTSSSIQFSGQATVINLTNSTQPPLVIIGDTGQLPPAGGDIEVSVSATNMEGLSIDMGHASTIGSGDTASSSVSLSNLRISFHVPSGERRTITADTILINVSATSTSNGAVVTASSDIEGLAVDGTNITVTGEANQVVDLGDFSLIVNAQVTNTTAQGGSIVLAALHLIDADLLEGFIGLAHADVQGGGSSSGGGGGNGGGGGGGSPPPSGECEDFVTGGGWIIGPGGAKANFCIGGGIRHGAFWGHLNFIDHATGMHVKATAVTGYDVTAELTRLIHFNVTIDGVAATADVQVTDNGEPGRNDTFEIVLSNGYSAGGSLGGDRPGGGNIQLHKAKCGKGNGGGEGDHDGHGSHEGHHECKGGGEGDHNGNGGGGEGDHNGNGGGQGGHDCKGKDNEGNGHDNGDHGSKCSPGGDNKDKDKDKGKCDSKPAPTGKGGAKSDTDSKGNSNNGKSDANKGKDSGKPAANCDSKGKAVITIQAKAKGKGH